MIAGIDHVVLVVKDIEATLTFYRDVLDLEILGEQEWRQGERPFPSLKVGAVNMLNVHEPDYPHGAANLQVGSEDLCFVWDGLIEEAVQRLKLRNVPIEVGPAQRRGARGVMGTSTRKGAVADMFCETVPGSS